MPETIAPGRALEKTRNQIQNRLARVKKKVSSVFSEPELLPQSESQQPPGMAGLNATQTHARIAPTGTNFSFHELSNSYAQGRDQGLCRRLSTIQYLLPESPPQSFSLQIWIKFRYGNMIRHKDLVTRHKVRPRNLKADPTPKAGRQILSGIELWLPWIPRKRNIFRSTKDSEYRN